MLKRGHSSGTVGAEPRAERGSQQRVLDRQSSVLPAWPRLLSLEQASLYLGLSVEVVRELINSGQLAPVRVPRPDTNRMHRGGPVSDTLRRLLLDRAALDALVEVWKSEGGR